MAMADRPDELRECLAVAGDVAGRRPGPAPASALPRILGTDPRRRASSSWPSELAGLRRPPARPVARRGASGPAVPGRGGANATAPRSSSPEVPSTSIPFGACAMRRSQASSSESRSCPEPWTSPQPWRPLHDPRLALIAVAPPGGVAAAALLVAACAVPTSAPTPSATPAPTVAPSAPPYVLAPSPSGCPTSAPSALPAGGTATVTMTTNFGDIVDQGGRRASAPTRPAPSSPWPAAATTTTSCSTASCPSSSSRAATGSTPVCPASRPRRWARAAPAGRSPTTR